MSGTGVATSGRAWLSLGSSIEPERNLDTALRELRGRFGPLAVSPPWRAAPVGYAGPEVVNLAVGLDSDLGPWALRNWLHGLERRLGRDRAAPRLSSHPLDADLVLFGDRVVDRDGLRLPHRDLLQPWVLGPLSALAPGLVDPRSGATLAELRQRQGL